MAKDKSIIAEVHKIIDDRIANGDPVQPAWVVMEIINTRPLKGVHADFYRAHAAKELARIVGRAVGRVGMTDDPDDPQMVLPGHKRLVKAYPVTRDGERVLVAIDRCTTAELLAHADILRKQAKGCGLHADDLEKYAKGRPEQEPAEIKEAELA